MRGAIARDDLRDLRLADPEVATHVLRDVHTMPFAEAVANDGTPIEILSGPCVDDAILLGRLSVLHRWLGPIKLGRRIRVYRECPDGWRRIRLRLPPRPPTEPKTGQP